MKPKNLEPLRDRDSLNDTILTLKELEKALGPEKCGEVIHRKLLELYSTFGIKMPLAFVDFARYYVKMGKSDLAFAQFEIALGCLAETDDTPINRMTKESIELDQTFTRGGRKHADPGWLLMDMHWRDG